MKIGRSARAVIGLAALFIALAATPVLANYVARWTLDRQVISSDYFVIARAAGDRFPCPSDPAYACTGVTVINSLNGDLSGRLSLQIEHPISESGVDCCKQGAMYAMALNRGGEGVVLSANVHWSIYELAGPWETSTAAAVDVTGWRPRTFIQNVYESDFVAVVAAKGDRVSCGEHRPPNDCTTLELIKALKGEVPKEFRMPTATLAVWDLSTGKEVDLPYDCCVANQIYLLALTGREGGLDLSNGSASIYRLGGPPS